VVSPNGHSADSPSLATLGSQQRSYA
jgi:hypothetical protein